MTDVAGILARIPLWATLSRRLDYENCCRIRESTYRIVRDSSTEEIELLLSGSLWRYIVVAGLEGRTEIPK